ncbi:AAA family ATPase [Terribacillus saccharophilus]|uniref:AAA family ATPase n=1 Tax=Terribacillus saccharophilus TaxID=361277 RepID=A0A268AAM9_9BACI|nr:AAA family ATPase [Terribacillus saccharophilus]PAD21184.1 AAA family ATPase [Terribacillus saccharophilus]PAF36211.1 AAA family ATPase [Terribacillus saccharophilus]
MNQYVRQMSLKDESSALPNHFPFSLPVIQKLGKLSFHPNVTYIIGENGMGKSTLLEAIAVALGFNPEGGSRNFSFSSYESHSNLHEQIRIVRGGNRPRDGYFFRAETFYNVATNIEEMDREGYGRKIIDSYGGKSLHEQSHGEAFFAAFMERFSENGLYILDEPEAALSPIRQLSMLARIDELVEKGSQFIISTHAPLLMAYPDSKILLLDAEGIEEVQLEATQHYSIMKQFFEDRGRLLHHLFRK